jgi:hypothetical protein
VLLLEALSSCLAVRQAPLPVARCLLKVGLPRLANRGLHCYRLVTLRPECLVARLFALGLVWLVLVTSP